MDSTGRTVATQTQQGPTIHVTVPAGGTAIVRQGERG